MIKFLILLILPLWLNAQVSMSAQKTFLSGEPIVFSITASGSDVDFPNITDIDGYVVQNAGTSSQTSIINGSRSQKLIRQYRFFATSNVTIPSFEIKVNGKVERTKEQKVVLQKISKTKSSNFDLTIKVNKDEVYVGEEILLTMTFKYKKSVQLYDLQFAKPNFENFWSKQIQTNSKFNDSEYEIQELSYLLFPQKNGTLDISSFRIDAILPDNRARNSFFGAATKTQRVYSNSLKVKAKELPDGVYLVGDFNIKSSVDKTTIKQGEAISYKLEIVGRGNIDDVEEFDLDISDATIYDNPSQKDFNILEGKYGGVYKKSYSIVSNYNFVIPSVTLKYFDKISEEVKTIKTQEYTIQVEGEKQLKYELEVKKETIEPSIQVKTKEVVKIIKTSNKEKAIFFFLGVVFTLVVLAIYFLIKNKKQVKEELSLEKSIKKCATREELLKKVVPFVGIDENLDKIIYKLESNDNVELKVVKKELVNILKELKL